MLSFVNVTKEYRLDDENTVTPVSHVDMEIKQGEMIVIIGRSGTGKTTLLNLAAGLVHPSAGRVMVNDRDLAEMTDDEISTLRGRNMGFVFQFPSLLPALTIKENVSLPAVFANRISRKDALARAEHLLGTLGLAGRMDVLPKQLSAGEQKRVVIARSLINEPKLVLADEPTSDLDFRTEKEVMEVLRQINASGVTFFIVTHSLELVDFATRAFAMENGTLKDITSQLGSARKRGNPVPSAAT